ncbi:syntaxin 6, N-terminal-domain-containing protein [Phellopilus nigrolimitatus]|nr:syntaxin 6, N-terminal-domain-containing protein [Phellopilus nigrolimitatus]
MSTDPYHVVQAEMQGTLASAGTLLSSFRRIRGMAASSSGAGLGAERESEELAYARSELKATLSALEADLEDLEESVRVVETTGPRYFGLDDSEVQTRRRYVRDVRRDLEDMRAEVAASENQGSLNGMRYAPSSPTSRHKTSTPKPHPGDDLERGKKEDDQATWSRMEQQMIMEEQDKTIDSITGTVSTLTEQAGLMGQEIGEHIELLGNIESNVDKTETKLRKSLRRIQRFARETEDTKSGWCIGILIAILCVLLLMVILI